MSIHTRPYRFVRVCHGGWAACRSVSATVGRSILRRLCACMHACARAMHARTHVALCCGAMLAFSLHDVQVYACVVLRWGAVGCGGVRCGGVRWGGVRCGGVRWGAVRCVRSRVALRCNALRCNARARMACFFVRCAALRCGAVRCGACTCVCGIRATSRALRSSSKVARLSSSAICSSLHIDMCIPTCIGMCIGMRIDVCIDMCVDMCARLSRSAICLSLCIELNCI